MTKSSSKPKSKKATTPPPEIKTAKYRYSGTTTSIVVPTKQEVTLVDGGVYDLPPDHALVVRLQSRGMLTDISDNSKSEEI